ncbi:MAG: thioredoxin domain-containing protein, partial [Candidatus Omnitrophica bacterium]|nr:thioredoxin domain-containing protein [Candidatus Omnitrophota bacterium]
EIAKLLEDPNKGAISWGRHAQTAISDVLGIDLGYQLYHALGGGMSEFKWAALHGDLRQFSDELSKIVELLMGKEAIKPKMEKLQMSKENLEAIVARAIVDNVNGTIPGESILDDTDNIDVEKAARVLEEEVAFHLAITLDQAENREQTVAQAQPTPPAVQDTAVTHATQQSAQAQAEPPATELQSTHPETQPAADATDRQPAQQDTQVQQPADTSVQAPQAEDTAKPQPKESEMDAAKAEVVLMEAAKLRDAKDFDEAIKILKKVYAFGQTHYDNASQAFVLTELGYTYYLSNLYPDAIEALSKAIELISKLPQDQFFKEAELLKAYLFRGIIYVNNKQYEKAIADFEKAPEEPLKYQQLAVAYRESGNYQKALESVDKALEFYAKGAKKDEAYTKSLQTKAKIEKLIQEKAAAEKVSKEAAQKKTQQPAASDITAQAQQPVQQSAQTPTQPQQQTMPDTGAQEQAQAPELSARAAAARREEEARRHAQEPEAANVLAVSDADFNAVTRRFRFNGPVMLKFWASWCGPCSNFAPAYEELHREIAGEYDVVTGTVNVDDSPNISQSYKIQSIPALIIVYPDGRVEKYNGIYVVQDQNDRPGLAQRMSNLREW